MTKTCRYCPDPFETKPGGHRRTYCYKPACADLALKAQNEVRKFCTARYNKIGPISKSRIKKKAAEAKKVWPYRCQTCGDPIKNGNRLNCEECRKRLSRFNAMSETDLSDAYGGLSHFE